MADFESNRLPEFLPNQPPVKDPSTPTTSLTIKLQSIIKKTVLIESDPRSIKELVRDTGFSTKQIKQLARSNELAGILNRSVQCADRSMKTLPAISKETGFSIRELSTMSDEDIQKLSTHVLEIDGKNMTRQELAQTSGLSIKMLCDLETPQELLGENAMVKTSEGFVPVNVVKQETNFSTLLLLQLKNEGLLTAELIRQAKTLKVNADTTKEARKDVEYTVERDLPGNKAFAPKEYRHMDMGMRHLAGLYKTYQKPILKAVKTKDQLSLLNVAEKRQLGKGGYAIASKVHDLAEQKDIVVKTPHADLDDFSKQLIDKGAEILQKIHKAAPSTRGIASSVQVDTTTGGTLGALYGRGELSEKVAMNFRAKQVQAMLMDTLSGLRTVHTLGIFHGDIKPENILVDDANKVAIADWDGAFDTKDIKENDQYENCEGICTPEFITKDELQILRLTRKDQIHEMGTIPLLEKRDGLALGLSLIEVLTGFSALTHIHNDSLPRPNALPLAFLKDKSIWKKVQQRGLTDAQINGIKWMIHPDVNKRKTPTEIFNALSNTGPKLPPFQI